MKKLLAPLFAVTLLLCACSPSLSTADSEAAVGKFHQQFDAGSFDEVYGNAAPELKAATSKDKFLSFMTVVHRKLGNILSTKQANWRVFAGTNGNFIDLVYNTTFEHGQGVESFRFRTDLGAPQLVGYNINSTDLITNDEKTASVPSASSNAILAS
jgi:hypothetical protein